MSIKSYCKKKLFYKDLRNTNCRVAKSTTSMAVIEELSENTNTEIRISLAKNSLCPSYILDNFSKSKKWLLRYVVACHPNTSEKTLKRLAKDESVIRHCVNLHVNATDEIREICNKLDFMEQMEK